MSHFVESCAGSLVTKWRQNINQEKKSCDKVNGDFVKRNNEKGDKGLSKDNVILGAQFNNQRIKVDHYEAKIQDETKLSGNPGNAPCC